MTKDSVLKDSATWLFDKFEEAVQRLCPTHDKEVAVQVHEQLLTKIYNTRCNEFLRSVTKLSCIKGKKAVDVNLGLRDELKYFASKKETSINYS